MGHLTGAFLNGVGIIAGSLLGLLLGSRLNEGFRTQSLQAIGLVVVVIGLKMAWPLKNPINTLLSMVVGGWIGSAISLDAYLERLGRRTESRFGGSGFSQAFVAGALIFNVGAMAVVGSLQAGLTGEYSILATKTVLDGITALFLTSASGWGVIMAAPVTVLYEGILSLLARNLTGMAHSMVMSDLTVVGGLIIAGIGLNFLSDRTLIKIPNLLPALLTTVLFGWLYSHVLIHL